MSELTTEELLQNQDYVDALVRRGMRQGKAFSTREQALEDFLDEYRGVQANTALALMFSNDIDNIRNDEERLQFGRLYKAVDEDLEDFAGQKSKAAIIADYGIKGILDPLNIFGLGVGKVVSQTLGRQAIKKLITDSFAKKGLDQAVKKSFLDKAKAYAPAVGTGAGAGAGVGAVEGVTQQTILENIKDEDALGYQDELNIGNIATAGLLGGALGAGFGAIGGALGARGVKKIEKLTQEQQLTQEAAKKNLKQNRIAQSKTVESFLQKINPLTKEKNTQDDVLGAYVTPAEGSDGFKTTKTFNPENYGEFPRIIDYNKRGAVLEFIPTKYAREINPATNKYDERVLKTYSLKNLKAVSQEKKEAYQSGYVSEFGLFFDKAGIEKGKQLLLKSGASETEVNNIFGTVLNKETFDDLTRFVYDAAQNIAQTMPNTKLARQVELTLDDPAKRVTEKVAELLRLGDASNSALLSDNINSALVKNGLNAEDAVNMLKADVSMAAAKNAEMSNIEQLLNPQNKLGSKLFKLMNDMTDAQKATLESVRVQRDIEKKMAKKFGVAVDIWRSFLVTQPATTMRNIFGSFMRVPGESFNSFLASRDFMLDFEAKALGIERPKINLKNETNLLTKSILSPNESIQIASIIGKAFPEADRQIFKMFDDYFTSSLEKETNAGRVLKTLHFASKWANVANRAQDRSIKSAGFVTELDNQIKQAVRNGNINPELDSLEKIIAKDRLDLINDEMVSKSLQFAYRLTYQSRNAGDDLVIGGEMINNLQRWANTTAAVKLGIPFPNFIINGLVYNLNRGTPLGLLKAARARIKIGQVKEADVKKDRERMAQIKDEISNLPNLKEDPQVKRTKLKNLKNELNKLEAEAGSRLKDVEDLRRGISESVEGATFIGAAIVIREKFGGARYDELKVGDTTVNVGPLFPLTPYLFIGEAIRKVLNDEPLDNRFVGEGIQALTGFQTDRAGPISKFFGGLQRNLTTVFESEDPVAYRKLGEMFGELAGYWASGYFTPGEAPGQVLQTFGPRKFRQTYDKEFQNIITGEAESLSEEAIIGAVNEFGRQMFRGTPLQNFALNQEAPGSGRQLTDISVTQTQEQVPTLPVGKQFTGIATVTPRGVVGDELERLNIPSWRLSLRTTVPEYNRIYKAVLGEASEALVKPIMQSSEYRNLNFNEQQKLIYNLYRGDTKDMSPRFKESMTRVFGKQYPNIRSYVSDFIKNEYNLLDELRLFRSRNSKAEIGEIYEKFPNLPPLKYLGEDTEDNSRREDAIAQNELLKILQFEIDNPNTRTSALLNEMLRNKDLTGILQQKARGERTGFNEGGYVSQMNALGFSKGGNVGRKGMSVLGKTADLNNPMTEAQREAGARSITSGSPLTQALGPGVNYVLESLGEVAKGDISKGAELAASKRFKTPTVPKEVKEQSISNVSKVADETAEALQKIEKLNNYVPKKTVKAYKLFKTDAKGVKEFKEFNRPGANAPFEGNLFPLFVKMADGKPIKKGVWVKAEVGEISTDGRRVKSSLGPLAPRPGFHAGDSPTAKHIGGKANPKTGEAEKSRKKPNYRRENQIWVEVEFSADVDWQKEAIRRASLKKDGTIDISTAHITDRLPTGGFYRYKTNPNMEGNWLISGEMKINKVLTNKEVDEINKKMGTSDLPRFEQLVEPIEKSTKVDKVYNRGGYVSQMNMLGL